MSSLSWEFSPQVGLGASDSFEFISAGWAPNSRDTWMGAPDPNVPYRHGKSPKISPIARVDLWVSYPQESRG